VSVIFDKLAFVRRLEGEDKFSRPQAEALSEALHAAMSETVATKADLVEVRHEISLLRSEMKTWTGSLGVVLFMALGGLMTVFKFLVH
jgi:hypothetical protein